MRLTRLLFTRLALPLLAILSGVSLPASLALAQSYPDHPIRIVVPFAAGGASDVVARAIAPKLTDKLGQSVIVENRTGAGGSLGVTQVVRGPADGYTLLLGSSSEIAQYPNVVSNPPYDALRDFTPIALIATVPLALTVIESLPVKSVPELLTYARQNPGKLNYGSAGVGSSTHLAMLLLTSMTGTTMTHVPYRGSAPVVADLLAGNLHLAIPTMSAVLPHAGGGKLRVIAVSTTKRAAALPELPTIAESGIPGLQHRPVDRPDGAGQPATGNRVEAPRRGGRCAGGARHEGDPGAGGSRADRRRPRAVRGGDQARPRGLARPRQTDRNSHRLNSAAGRAAVPMPGHPDRLSSRAPGRFRDGRKKQ
jgi:tripartite-type tricarboxylate transporter receptor subunit TctC